MNQLPVSGKPAGTQRDRPARFLKPFIEPSKGPGDKPMSLPSVTAASDATTAGDTLLFPIVGALAERERAIIWERTLADLTVARARGRKGGQPSALTNKPLVAAITILKRPGIQVEEGTRRLKVAPLIRYRYRPDGRGSVVEPAE